MPKSSRARASALLVATFLFATYLIFVDPFLSKLSPPGAVNANNSTLIEPHDVQVTSSSFEDILTSLTAVVDGSDEALRIFMLWFVVQLAGVLVFTYWESGRDAPPRSLVRAYVHISLDR